MLIIAQAEIDPSILKNRTFNERNYAIREIQSTEALSMRDVYKDSLMYMINEEDFESVRMLETAFKQDDRYYALTIISSTLEKDDLIEDLLYSILWLYVVLLASVLIINNFVLRKMWEPFHQLLDKIGRFNLETNPVITPTPSKVKEFNLLDTQLVNLAKHSAQAYSSQKQFLENAAHELQTPLAITINKLELLLEQEDIPERHLQAILGVSKNLHRLTRINKALLLLSKIENKQFGDRQPVEMTQLVERSWEQFEDLAESKQLVVEIEKISPLTFELHPDLASVLVSNLLKNACVHTSSGGQIRIRIDAESLIISNSAKHGQGALPEEKIFERFQKDSSDHQRVGLGLAIVRAICEASGLQLVYHFEQAMHHFRLKKA
jgi:signal transduction histidine kinase